MSEAVGLHLRVRSEELRLYDPDKGRDLLSYSEWAKEHAREKATRKAAEDLAAKAETARKAAEARIAESEAHLRNSRG